MAQSQVYGYPKYVLTTLPSKKPFLGFLLQQLN